MNRLLLEYVYKITQGGLFSSRHKQSSARKEISSLNDNGMPPKPIANKLLLEYLDSILNELRGKVPGEVWISATGKSWGAMNQLGAVEYFDKSSPNSKELADRWANGPDGQDSQQTSGNRGRSRLSKDKPTLGGSAPPSDQTKTGEIAMSLAELIKDGIIQMPLEGNVKYYKKDKKTLNVGQIIKAIEKYISKLSEEDLDFLRNAIGNKDYDFLNSIDLLTLIKTTGTPSLGNFTQFTGVAPFIEALELDNLTEDSKEQIDNATSNLRPEFLRFFMRNSIIPRAIRTFDDKQENIQFMLGRGTHEVLWEALSLSVTSAILSTEQLKKQLESNKKFKLLLNQLTSHLSMSDESDIERLKNSLLNIFVRLNEAVDTDGEFEARVVELLSDIFGTGSDASVQKMFNDTRASAIQIHKGLIQKNRVARHIDRSLENYRNELAKLADEFANLTEIPSKEVFDNFRRRADAAYRALFTLPSAVHNLDPNTAVELMKTLFVKTSEYHEYFRELLYGEEVYYPAHGSFPAGDKIRVDRFLETSADGSIVERVIVNHISIKSKYLTDSTGGAESEFSKYPRWVERYAELSDWPLGWKEDMPFQMTTGFATDPERFNSVVIESGATSQVMDADGNVTGTRSIFLGDDKQEEFRSTIVALQEFARGGDASMRSYLTAPENPEEDPVAQKRYEIYQRLLDNRPIRTVGDGEDAREVQYSLPGETTGGDSYLGYVIEVIRLLPPEKQDEFIEAFANTNELLHGKRMVEIVRTMKSLNSEIIFPYYFNMNELNEFLGNKDNILVSTQRGLMSLHMAVIVGASLNAHDHYNSVVKHMHYEFEVVNGVSTLSISEMPPANGLGDWKLKYDMFVGGGLVPTRSISPSGSGFGGAVRIRRYH